MKRCVIAFSLITLFTISACGQKNGSLEKGSLRGLPGVNVYISGLNSDIEQEGLTKEQIQTDVEVRLRKAGIRVLSFEETRKSTSKPILMIQILTLRSKALSELLGASVYSYSISIELNQTANLKRFPDNEFLVITWSDNAVGMTTAKSLRTIRDGVGDYVDKFINDFLTVNPK